MTHFDDATLTAAVESGRRLEPTDAEVAVALQRAARPARRRRRLTIGAAAIALLAGGGYAVPVTRAAMDDVFGGFASYFDGGGGAGVAADAPGRPLRPSDDAPAWVREGRDRRLIAEVDGHAMYAIREPGGRIGFALGDGFGIADTPDGWREEFSDHAVVVLGPEAGGTGPHGARERALFGLTARSVDRVELRYSEGPPAVDDSLRGGFAVMWDENRQAEWVVAFDAHGRELERVPLDHLNR
jgi:hypothetical protein